MEPLVTLDTLLSCFQVRSGDWWHSNTTVSLVTEVSRPLKAPHLQQLFIPGWINKLILHKLFHKGKAEKVDKMIHYGIFSISFSYLHYTQRSCSYLRFNAVIRTLLLHDTLENTLYLRRNVVEWLDCVISVILHGYNSNNIKPWCIILVWIISSINILMSLLMDRRFTQHLNITKFVWESYWLPTCFPAWIQTSWKSFYPP